MFLSYNKICIQFYQNVNENIVVTVNIDIFFKYELAPFRVTRYSFYNKYFQVLKNVT
jgi:hypothetical protein